MCVRGDAVIFSISILRMPNDLRRWQLVNPRLGPDFLDVHGVVSAEERPVGQRAFVHIRIDKVAALYRDKLAAMGPEKFGQQPLESCPFIMRKASNSSARMITATRRPLRSRNTGPSAKTDSSKGTV
jgi:hypothetical protein